MCSGTAVGLREVVDLFRKSTGIKPEVVTDPEKVRSNEVDIICGDPANIRACTGWSPAIPLTRTVIDMLAYWEEKLSQPAESPRVRWKAPKELRAPNAN